VGALFAGLRSIGGDQPWRCEPGRPASIKADTRQNTGTKRQDTSKRRFTRIDPDLAWSDTGVSSVYAAA